MRVRSRISIDIRWGLGWSVWVAGLFSAYVLVVALVRGSSEVGQGRWPVWLVLVGYWTAALLCGALLGAIRPLAATRLGAFFVGAMVGFLGYGTVGAVVYGLKRWVVWTSLAASMMTGGLGVVVRDGNRLGTDLSSRRIAFYAVLLFAAAVLLWLDIKFHIVNK